MQKNHSIAEVIEHLDFGEVAVKVINGGRLDEGSRLMSLDVGEAVYYDEKDDGVLKAINGKNLVIRKGHKVDESKDKFIIMSKEAFDKISNG